MDKQTIFDTVVNHLAAQGTQSMSGGDPDTNREAGCAYRGDNGTKCAVGCLIPDDMYNPKMENATVVSLAQRKELPAELYEHVDMLSDLQYAHDWSTSAAELIDKLCEIARDHHLDGASVSNITKWVV